MDARIAVALVLLAASLAGCADDAAPVDTPEQQSTDPAAVSIKRLDFGAAPHSMQEQFSGHFDFHQNDQFYGMIMGEIGADPANMHTYDVDGLLPTEGLFFLYAELDGSAGSGDLDLFLTGDDTIISSRCVCPFGDYNELLAFGVGSGSVSLNVMFDEISTGPTDPGAPLTGVDYDLEVTVIAAPNVIPPGTPIGIELEPGDVVAFQNHTQTVTVYSPDDVQVAILDIADTEFTIPQNGTAGEYVFVGQINGEAFAATVTSPAERTSRILSVTTEIDQEAFAPGESGTISFDAPATVLEVGACGITHGPTRTPEFTITSPDGEEWYSDSSSSPIDPFWGNCVGNWRGAPDQMPGTWKIEFDQETGWEFDLFSLAAYYVR